MNKEIPVWLIVLIGTILIVVFFAILQSVGPCEVYKSSPRKDLPIRCEGYFK